MHVIMWGIVITMVILSTRLVVGAHPKMRSFTLIGLSLAVDKFFVLIKYFIRTKERFIWLFQCGQLVKRSFTFHLGVGAKPCGL